MKITKIIAVGAGQDSWGFSDDQNISVSWHDGKQFSIAFSNVRVWSVDIQDRCSAGFLEGNLDSVLGP